MDEVPEAMNGLNSRTPVTIVWFRRDLRLADNPALSYAASRGGTIVPVYLTDWEREDRWSPGLAARWWLARSLESLTERLQTAGAPLHMVGGDPVEALVREAADSGADEVVWNRVYEPYSRRLDEQAAIALEARGIGARGFGGALLFEPEGHVSRAGRPFVQFGAFWRSCSSLPEPGQPLAAPVLASDGRRGDGASGQTVDAASGIPGAEDAGWTPGGKGQGTTWEPGEAGAHARLLRFLREALDNYAEARDLPAEEGVSRLSPHLHFGEIGSRQVWHEVTRSQGPGARDGAEAFLRQLGWRDFGHYLLYHFPASATQPFRPAFTGFPWLEDPEGLDSWKAGRTGFPLVDAGMRQLLAEGWMHNRVRMVAASFLTKDLLIPWQEGAAWFWDRLVDADLANNTLGWQWTAGSGPDAAPFFRVFNPDLQARRFDPTGAYVARWNPDPGSEGPPDRLVDHAAARLRALAAFDEVRRHR